MGRSAVLAVLWCLVAGLNGAWECNPIYEYQQFHPGDSEPWQAYFFFKNVTPWHLCEYGSRLDCPGTIDQFQFTDTEGEARDWFMFFGQTDGDVNRWCFVWDEYDWGKFLAACSYRWWEPGRSGPGNQDHGGVSSWKAYPFGRERLTHWVRHYDRGACGGLWEREDVTALRDKIAEHFREKLGDSAAIHSVDLIQYRMRFRLGSRDWDDVTADNLDFIVFEARYKVVPSHWLLAWGSWITDIRLHWRFTVGTRAKYLYCEDDHDCDDDPYLPCVTDEDCTKFVHGAQCTPGATPEEPGHCFKGPALDVADYLFDFATEPHCGGACGWVYYAFVNRLAHLAGDQDQVYWKVYLPIIEGIQEGMWTEVPYGALAPMPGHGPDCETAEDCYVAASAYGGGLEWKCAASGPVNGEGGTACYARPDHIWGVNQYPWTLEFVLVPYDDNQEFPEEGLFSAGGLCHTLSSPQWSGIGHDWVE